MDEPRSAGWTADRAVGPVLILGGTAEARALAAGLHAGGIDVVSSLAGRVRDPALPLGRVRIGGFGGAAGLAAFLRTDDVRAMVDATHPFAVTMSQHAGEAAAMTGVPLLRLTRPGWGGHPDARTWHWVPTHADAASTAVLLGRRPMLTTGRQTLDRYAALPALGELPVLARLVEPPERPLPLTWRVVRSRGPYLFAAELELLARERIDVLVTKDSGGTYTGAKLIAAQALSIPVVVVSRPLHEPARPVSEVDDVAAAVSWVRGVIDG